MFGLSSIPAALQAMGMIFLPSSPRWLLTKGREMEVRFLKTFIYLQQNEFNCEIWMALLLNVSFIIADNNVHHC